MSIVLQNGAEVEWRYADAFCDAQLEVVKQPTEQTGCGNPWNWMTEKEDALVRSKQPPNRVKPCKIDSMMYHKVYTSTKDIGGEIKATINADCWGIFTTNADRSHLIRTYFDARQDETDQKERNRLASDPADLLLDINVHHRTVVVVLGQQQFMESYFFKVAPGVYLSVKVDHSINAS